MQSQFIWSIVNGIVCLQLSDGFNGADMRNVVTEAGMFAIREDRYALLPIC